MTNNKHPITPPPELVEDWIEIAKPLPQRPPNPCELAALAARWSADQELEACCVWLEDHDCEDPQEVAKRLRAARRPKPPSHKELALIALTALEACAAQSSDTTESVFYIRRALESLPE